MLKWISCVNLSKQWNVIFVQNENVIVMFVFGIQKGGLGVNFLEAVMINCDENKMYNYSLETIMMSKCSNKL